MHERRKFIFWCSLISIYRLFLFSSQEQYFLNIYIKSGVEFLCRTPDPDQINILWDDMLVLFKFAVQCSHFIFKSLLLICKLVYEICLAASGMISLLKQTMVVRHPPPQVEGGGYKSDTTVTRSVYTKLLGNDSSF